MLKLKMKIGYEAFMKNKTIVEHFLVKHMAKIFSLQY